MSILFVHSGFLAPRMENPGSAAGNLRKVLLWW